MADTDYRTNFVSKFFPGNRNRTNLALLFPENRIKLSLGLKTNV